MSPSRMMKRLTLTAAAASLVACADAGYFVQHTDGNVRTSLPIPAGPVLGPEMNGVGEPASGATDFGIPGAPRAVPRSTPVAPAASGPGR